MVCRNISFSSSMEEYRRQAPGPPDSKDEAIYIWRWGCVKISLRSGIRITADRKDAVSDRPAIGMGALSPDVNQGIKNIIGRLPGNFSRLLYISASIGNYT